VEPLCCSPASAPNYCYQYKYGDTRSQSSSANLDQSKHLARNKAKSPLDLPFARATKHRNTPYSDLCHRPTAVVRVNFPDLPVGSYSHYHLTYVLHSYKGHGAQTKIHLCFFHPPSDNYRRSHPKSFLIHLDFTNSDISITAMNVNKKFDRFKQWAGEKMGGDAKTNTSDDFKMLELEMNLRHEGREKSPSHSFY
jgi:hypothetical protein